MWYWASGQLPVELHFQFISHGGEARQGEAAVKPAFPTDFQRVSSTLTKRFLLLCKWLPLSWKMTKRPIRVKYMCMSQNEISRWDSRVRQNWESPSNFLRRKYLEMRCGRKGCCTSNSSPGETRESGKTVADPGSYCKCNCFYCSYCCRCNCCTLEAPSNYSTLHLIHTVQCTLYTEYCNLVTYTLCCTQNTLHSTHLRLLLHCTLGWIWWGPAVT